jgi:hypothetical protein
MSSDDMFEKLTALKDTIETLEKQMERGMTEQEKQEAIGMVSQTIELLQKLQGEEALKTARVVDAAEDDESPLK